MEEGKPFLLNIFTFNYLRGYLVENPIQTLIIRRHIVYLVWFIKRAWAACGINMHNLQSYSCNETQLGLINLNGALNYI